MQDSIKYYQEHAKEYFTQTCHVDMHPLRNQFLSHVSSGGKILDAGCGSGRDAKAFLQAGYSVEAFDASPAMVKLATRYLGQKVEIKRFQELSDHNKFDGIWGCASLLHLPPHEIADVFRRLRQSLKIGGVLYASFKYGNGVTQMGGRWFTNMDETSFSIMLNQVGGFSILDMWTNQDRRSGRPNEIWFNVLLSAVE